MSIKYKVLIPALSGLLLLALILTLHSLHDSKKMSNQELAKIFLGKYMSMEVGVAETAGEALSHASLYSRQPAVQNAYREALTGNIDDPADPLVHEQRLGLRQWMSSFTAGFKASMGKAKYKLHFHLPNGRSMLRSWRKTQSLSGKDESDDISSFRKTVTTINQTPHLPIQGIEVGRGGFAIRGIAPVADIDGSHLGSVEMLYSFNRVTGSLKSRPNQEMAVFMNRELLDVATSLQKDPDAHPFIGDFVLVNSTNMDLFTSLLGEDLLKEGAAGLSEIQDKGNYQIQAWPIRDYSGKTIGVMAFLLDISASRSALASSRNETLLLTLLLTAIAGTLLFFILRGVVKPIHLLMETANTISESSSQDHSVPQSLLEGKDETGNLARAFERMLDSLRNSMDDLGQRRDTLARKVDEALGHIEVFASGDLRTRMECADDDELSRLRDGFNEALARIGNLIRELAGDSDHLANQSEQLQGIASSMKQQADATSTLAGDAKETATDVNHSIQAVASATEEMEASIHEIAQNATKAAEVAESATRTASEANGTIQQLERSSHEIEEVVKTISAIAEQTNLLALNATIEAARAGEAGKGFAVVAGEVKDLAAETNRATEDIVKRIGVIQSDTKQTISAITEITSVIHEIHGIETSIASAVEEQAVTTQEISRSIGQAAGGSMKIVENLEGVFTAASDSAEHSTKTDASSSSLSDLAVAIRQRIDSFSV